MTTALITMLCACRVINPPRRYADKRPRGAGESSEAGGGAKRTKLPEVSTTPSIFPSSLFAGLKRS
jgi:hypothetical protein